MPCVRGNLGAKSCPSGDDIHCSRSMHVWNSCAEILSSPDRCFARERQLGRPQARRLSRESHGPRYRTANGSERGNRATVGKASICYEKSISSLYPARYRSRFCNSLLRCRIVARRWLLLPDIWRMTIGAFARFLVLRELFFDRHGLRIRDLLIVLMTARARSDRHIRC